MEYSEIYSAFEWLRGSVDHVYLHINKKNTEQACFILGNMREFLDAKAKQIKDLIENQSDEKEDQTDPEDERKIQLHFADCLRELADIIEKNNQ